MAEERKILLELEVDKAGAQKSLEENALALELNKGELKELNEQYKRNEIGTAEFAKKQLQLKTENKDLNKTNRDLIRTLDTEDNSLNALRQNLSKLTAERNNTNQATAEGRERFEQLQKSILETTTAIKGQEEAGGDYRRSVGNYGKALTDNVPILGQFQQQLEGIKAAFIAQQQVTKGSIRSLGLFRVALISTGIGAIVVALGSLITFLATTQRGIDAVTKVTRPLQQIFQRLIGVVQDLGGDAFDFLAEAIQNPIQALRDLGDVIVENVINRFKSLAVFGEAISELFKGNFSASAKLATDAYIQLGTGITNATDKIQSAGEAVIDFANNAIDAGLTIDELTKSIELNEIALIKLEGTNQRIFEQQKEIAENSEGEIESRIAAAREALRVQTELEQARIDQLNRRIELKKLENEANDTNREDLKELAELEAQRDQAAADAAGKRVTVQNLLNTLLKEQNKELEEAQATEEARQQLSDFQLSAERIQAQERIKIKQDEVDQIKVLTFDAAEAQRRSAQTVTDAQREQAEIRRQIQQIENQNTLLAAGQLAGAISGLLQENTIAYKAAASIEAAISTYGAINKTLNDPTIPSTVGRVLSAVAIGVKGFANVAKINNLFGGGGGATPDASATSQPRIDTRTSLGGAFDRNQLTGTANAQQAQTDQLTNSVANMPAPVVRVSDINKTQSRTQQVTVNAGL